LVPVVRVLPRSCEAILMRLIRAAVLLNFPQMILLLSFSFDVNFKLLRVPLIPLKPYSTSDSYRLAYHI
jgi:hypothetical protein